MTLDGESRARSSGVEGAHTDTVNVRTATLADLPTVVDLRLALLREYEGESLYGALRPDVEARAYELYRHQLQSPDQTILLAEYGGSTVGILRCLDTLGSPLVGPNRYCYVSSAYVLPAARRTGILRALLGQAERWCRTRGLTEMRLHNSSVNTSAIDAWDALAFSVVEQVRIRKVDRRVNG